MNDTTQMAVSGAVALGAGYAGWKWLTSNKLAVAGIVIGAYIGARVAVRGIANMPQLNSGS